MLPASASSLIASELKTEIRISGATVGAQFIGRSVFAFVTDNAEYKVSYAAMGSAKSKCRILNACPPSDTEYPTQVEFITTTSILTNADYLANPDLQLFPAAGLGIVAAYNLPFLRNETLSPAYKKGLILPSDVLADIFRQCDPLKICPPGWIDRWNDTRIASANPHINVEDLTRAGKIQVVVRGEAAGGTEIFKRGLAKYSTAFASQLANDLSDTPNWTNCTNIKRLTNRGVSGAVMTVPFSIGYTSLDEAVSSGLLYAGARESVLASDGVLRANKDSISAALVELGTDFGNNGDLPKTRLTVTASGARGINAWPFIGYTYFAIHTNMSTSSRVQRKAAMHFFMWFYTSPKALAAAASLDVGALPESARRYILGRLQSVFRYADDLQLVYVSNSTSDYVFQSSAFPVDLGNENENVKVAIVTEQDMNGPLFYVSSTYGSGLTGLATLQITYDEFYLGQIDARSNLYFFESTESQNVPDFPNEKWLEKHFAAVAWGALYNLCATVACNGAGDVGNLALDLQTVYAILAGHVIWWNDTAVQGLQLPGVQLPQQQIKLVLTSTTSKARRVMQYLLAEQLNLTQAKFADELVNNANIEFLGRDQNETISAIMEKRYSFSYGMLGRQEDAGVPYIRTAKLYQAGGSTALSANYSSTLACFERSSDAQKCWPLVETFSFKTKIEYTESECQTRIPQEIITFLDYFVRSLPNEKNNSASTLEALLQLGFVAINSTETLNILNTVSCYGRSIVNPQVDAQLLPKSMKWASMFFSGVAVIAFVILSIWLYTHRGEKIVQASSPLFGQQMILGYICCMLSIFPMTIEDDGTTSPELLDVACMAWPWLYIVGFYLVYSALLVKTLRVYLLFHNQRMRRVKIRPNLMFRWEAVIGLPFFVILISWSVIDPMRYYRTPSIVDASTGFIVQTAGQCSSHSIMNYLIPLITLVITLVTSGLVLAWKNRLFPTEFSEGKYVSAAIWCDFQVLVVLIPLLALLSGNVVASFIVRVLAVLLSNIATATIFFGPKVAVVHGLWRPDDSTVPLDWYPKKRHGDGSSGNTMQHRSRENKMVSPHGSKTSDVQGGSGSGPQSRVSSFTFYRATRPVGAGVTSSANFNGGNSKESSKQDLAVVDSAPTSTAEGSDDNVTIQPAAVMFFGNHVHETHSTQAL